MKYRADIDGLRALAILPVVIYHFKDNIGFNGFMGVDIFFVISGYLITNIIYGEITEKKFSLRHFYERRIRRIIPAFIAVLAVCSLCAFTLLMPAELAPFAKSALTSLIFSSNILFFMESGYFDTASELKPLLHTWSLAVEEQFYIIFPLIVMGLFKLRASIIPYVLMLLFAASFAAALTLGFLGLHEFAFYMFPIRAWELLVGAMLAVWALPQLHQREKLLNISAYIGFGLIIAGFSIKIDPDIPYALYVFPVVFGTGLILGAGQYGRGEQGQGTQTIHINRAFSNGLMTFFGKISYSLYLWHWPVYVFLSYALIEELSTAHIIGGVLASILFGWLSFKYIESPIRHPDFKVFSKKSLCCGGTIITLVIALNGFVIINKGYSPIITPELRQIVNTTLGGNYMPIELFNNGDEWLLGAKGEIADVRTVLIGDSHALALSPAIDKLSKERNEVALLLQNRCFALEGSLPSKTPFNECMATTEEQIKFFDSVPHIDTIIIAQRWKERTEHWYRSHGIANDEFIELRKQTLINYIRAIAKPHRKIIVIAQAPPITQGKENIPSLYARYIKSGREIPDIFYPQRSTYLNAHRHIISILQTVEDSGEAKVIWPHDLLCGVEKCTIYDGKGFIYYDDDHLSSYGALLLLDALKHASAR